MTGTSTTGVSIAGLGVGGSVQNGPDTIGVDLAGDEPVPVVGTILDPLAGGGEFAYRPRAFTLLLSEDGSTYREALSAELGPQTVEQAFLLPEPVMASYAQLRIDSTWGATPASLTLGEWKVIAAPGFAPEPARAGLDIAAFVRGGHVVYIDPEWQAASRELLNEADTNLSTQALDPTETQTWAIGFFGDRAAQVTRIEWVDQVGSVPENRFTTVDVAVSVDSPLGPWEPLGTWALERAADGSVAPFVLPQATWARFVRLTALGSSEVSGVWELPGAIRVIERATDDAYRSILGEWGQSSPRGIYELIVPPPAFDAASDAADVGGTAAEAARVEAGSATDGQVSRVSGDVDWYAITVPEGDNTLTISLRTERARDVRPRVLDASGEEVDLQERGRRGEPPVESWTAIVEPGEYRLELVQPVLSVVIAFDTSASIYPWFPKLRAAVRSFADDVTPGQEAIQIFGFQETELLQDWSDQPYLIGGAIDAWVTEGGSSALRVSVVDAARMLQVRDGMRAILVFGDAVGGGFEAAGLPVVDFDQVRPVIFPVHLGGTDDPAVSTRIMQDLAAAGDGFYQYATSQAALERAFDRMATWLRRPAPYSMSYETSAVEYPPGTIAIVPAQGTAVPIGGGVGVELILDTSGSMLKPLGGTTRMEVARDVLTRLVDASLPEGLPVALRTFKAATKKSRCGTVLAVPLGPLDRAQMVAVIDELKIDRRTSTPIGAALAEVAGDIGDATGPKVVVLVTDGEETCEGDPGAEVQRLVDAGFEATINIVGFALDDPELKLEMKSWSTLGGGRFYDAQDQESLLAGIAAALQAPFRVFDDEGVLIASGIVDGPGVQLPVGTYRVEVLTDPVVTFEDVDVPAGAGVQLTVGEAPAPLTPEPLAIRGTAFAVAVQDDTSAEARTRPSG